jgi:glycosyltransferase involved in cell wall biosynthesis
MEAGCVSVILPVFNGERYLAEAVESVLCQTFRKLELIVIDDGSTDGSGRVARSYDSSRLRYRFQENQGLSAARNKGVSISKGEFLSFLDADDLWTREKLALQMKALSSGYKLDMVFGHVRQFLSPDVVEDITPEGRPEEAVLPGYSAGTMLIKKESFLRVGPFDVSLRLGHFVDWYAKAQEFGLKHELLPEVVMKRRIHAANMGIRERGSREDYLRILKSSLDRRRKKEPPSPEQK